MFKRIRIIIAVFSLLIIMSSFMPRYSISRDCLSRNSWIFGKVLYDCYGEDSLRTWLLDNRRCVLFIWFDKDGKISDAKDNRYHKRTIPIDVDSIIGYIIENNIQFEFCTGVDAPGWYGPLLDSLFALESEWDNEWISVGIPAGFPCYSLDKVENTDKIIESLQKPFCLLGKGVTQHLTQEEYNECNEYILISSLINLLGDWKVYKLCLDGLNLTIKLDLSKDRIPIDGIVLDSFELFDRENLLQQLLSAWKFYNISFIDGGDNPDNSIIVSLNIKISDHREFEDILDRYWINIRDLNNYVL